jgi:hypothetical protein
MVDIHIIFDGSLVLTTINLIIVAILFIIIIQVINNIYGGHKSIFKEIQNDKITKTQNDKITKTQNDKITKTKIKKKDELKDEKNKKGIFGRFKK